MVSDEARLTTEIKARIAWGEDPEHIRDWLHEQDAFITNPQLESVLQTALQTNSGTLFWGGLLRAILGGLLMISAIRLAMSFGDELVAQLSQFSFWMVLLAAVLGGLALILIFRGINQLFNGAAMRNVIHSSTAHTEDTVQ